MTIQPGASRVAPTERTAHPPAAGWAADVRFPAHSNAYEDRIEKETVVVRWKETQCELAPPALNSSSC
jgi:hypothetical protein